MAMSKSISVCNQKGGVGKTTTAVNVGAYLALSGKRVLIIDLDSQGNATISSGSEKGVTSKTVYDVIVEGASFDDVIVSSCVEKLDIVPSSIDLAGVDIQISQFDDREYIIRKSCEKVRETYDVILFDCPPSLGLLTVNALVASDDVLIPVQCEYLALEGLNTLMKAIELVKKGPNPQLGIGGIVFTMVDTRANLTKEVTDEVRKFFGALVCETTIPRNVRLAESPSFGKPICAYDPHSAGASAYQLLANELSEKLIDKELQMKKYDVAI